MTRLLRATWPDPPHSPAGSTHSTESSWADATCRLGGFADLLGVQVHDAVTGRPGPEAKEPFHATC